MLEGILAVEEEHANDMHDLLVAHEGRPMLPARSMCGRRPSGDVADAED